MGRVTPATMGDGDSGMASAASGNRMAASAVFVTVCKGRLAYQQSRRESEAGEEFRFHGKYSFLLKDSTLTAGKDAAAIGDSST
jgi:hypothetical protein